MNAAFLESVATVPYLATDTLAWLYYGLAHGLRPHAIVECGVYQGYVTAFLALAAKEIASGREGRCELYAVDNCSLVPAATVAANLDRCGVADAVTFLRHDSVSALQGLAQAGHLSHGPCLIVLDTLHTLEMTRGEIAAVWDTLPDGSLIGSHDAQFVGFPGVHRAFCEHIEQTGNSATWYPQSGGVVMVQKRKMGERPALLSEEEFRNRW